MKLFLVLTKMHFCAFFAFCALSCSNDLAKIEEDKALQDSLGVQKSNFRNSLPQEGDLLYACVDNLRMRETPDLKGKVLLRLPESSEIIYTGEESENTAEAEINGEVKSAPFYKVKAQTGEIGWVFGGGVSMKKPNVSYYKAVVAFFDEKQGTDAEIISDWSVHSSEALDTARKAGVLTFFVDKGFNKVVIKNKEGLLLEEVNIEGFVKKYGRGLVCIEKGKKPHFINSDPSMASELVEHFQLKN